MNDKFYLSEGELSPIYDTYHKYFSRGLIMVNDGFFGYTRDRYINVEAKFTGGQILYDCSLYREVEYSVKVNRVEVLKFNSPVGHYVSSFRAIMSFLNSGEIQVYESGSKEYKRINVEAGGSGGLGSI